MEPTSLLVAGIVGAARGLRGEVGVEVRTDRPQAVFGSGAKLKLRDGRTLTVTGARPHNDRLYLTFAGVTSREDAEALRGQELLVAAELEDDAWYPHQLEGLPAVTGEGEQLGTVTGIYAGVAQDMLVVETAEGTEVLVPLVVDLVPEVDLDAGRVVVSPPEGLF